MKVIGLCGGSGSGKGSVCEIFSELSVPSIDTDLVYREMTSADSPCIRELRREFGDGIVNSDGSLNRGMLRALVFSSADSETNRHKLNTITHRFILHETRRIISEQAKRGAPAIIVDAPLLYESGFDRECDVTVCVIADENIRVSRIVARDGISEDDARKRIAGQISNEELIRRADFVIDNNGDLVLLREEVLNLYKKIII